MKPSKKGDKFIYQGNTYTVKSFYTDYKEYNTYEEAKKNSTSGRITVINSLNGMIKYNDIQ